MKKILFFITFLTGSSFAQTNYTITKNAYIYDLPGGDFLTAITINDKTNLKHYDISGNIIWEDSLIFTPAIPNVHFCKIARFKNSNDYIICTYADPTSSAEPITSNTNDTLVYQFSKLNLSSHTITGNQVDTFYCRNIDLVEFNDTSIYLFTVDQTSGISPFHHATFSLNTGLSISSIAPMDSVEVWPYGWRYYVYGDSLYKYQFINNDHFIEKFSSSMSKLQSSFGTFNVGPVSFKDFSYYKQSINYDSVFVFTQYENSFDVKWRMDWVSMDFSQINFITFDAPSMNYYLAPLRYSTNYYKIALDKQNRKIMILANESGNLVQELVQKIFVYDYNFNLECEIPITMGSKTTNQLTELNDLVYLNIVHPNSNELIYIGCEVLETKELKSGQNDINLYPNPTTNLLFIENNKSTPMKIEIYSMEGKLMKEVSESNSLISIDINKFEKGVYIVFVESNGIKKMKKVIKN